MPYNPMHYNWLIKTTSKNHFLEDRNLCGLLTLLATYVNDLLYLSCIANLFPGTTHFLLLPISSSLNTHFCPVLAFLQGILHKYLSVLLVDVMPSLCLFIAHSIWGFLSHNMDFSVFFFPKKKVGMKFFPKYASQPMCLVVSNRADIQSVELSHARCGCLHHPNIEYS